MKQSIYTTVGLMEFHRRARIEQERQDVILSQLKAILLIDERELIEEIQKLPYSLDTILRYVLTVGKLPSGNIPNDNLDHFISSLPL